MSFLDKAKKLAEQAAEKAAPLIDKAAPHAQNVVDKAGQQIDRRTGGKYRDKIEAVEAKVGELAERRMATRDGAAETAAVADEAFPAQPGAAAPPTTDDAFPAQPGATAPPITDAFPDQPKSAPFPAQPDLTGQPDDPAYSAAAPTDIGFPAQPADTAAPAQPDLAGQPDDPAHSVTPGQPDFPGLSEAPGEIPEVVHRDDQPPTGPAREPSSDPTP